ncbi:DNA-binding response regulator [Nocardioides mangrovicus]|uniref:DNA-binding response regulator n=1 Tax=Nocardioides mangrovicus TaxID=2478913 RepID=A0A3L8P3M7_9ACTN|nr:response regulator transcription factor [Nocardioides mangrovicus]RLV49393.1 DNA-binding response regulator [Nocardioides mangrovicus]
MGGPRDRRVVILDSHDIFRMGLRQALEEHHRIEVVGEAAEPAGAFEQVMQTRPDAVIVGVREHERSTIDALAWLLARRPTNVLVLSRAARAEEMEAAQLVGAKGYLSKDLQVAQLHEVIEQIAEGEAVFGDSAGHLVDDEPEPPGVSDLTSQERRVLELVGRGHSNGEIARELFIAEKTVRNHVTRILAKLGVKRRTQAVLIAAQLRSS